MVVKWGQIKFKLWPRAKGVGNIPSAWLCSAIPNTRAAGLSRIPTLSEKSVLGEIRSMTFSTSDRRAIASGVVASGTIIPEIAELNTETKRVKKSHTAMDANAAVTVFWNTS